MFIALLTDFGTKDYFVGAMKGVILTINAEAKIIDVTHEIEPQNIQSASFTLANCYQNFPPKTIFVAVVDPGVGSARRAILAETENYYFIAPDNGLLNLVLSNESNYRVFEITNQDYFLNPVSHTFHGRDIFAPSAAWLSKGVETKDFGKEIFDLKFFDNAKPKRISENEIEGEIIHIDRFGNLVTNLKINDLKFDFSIEFEDKKIDRHLTHYAEAKTGEIFTIWGSADYLEIVAFKNSATQLLNAKIGCKIVVKY